MDLNQVAEIMKAYGMTEFKGYGLEIRMHAPVLPPMIHTSGYIAPAVHRAPQDPPVEAGPPLEPNPIEHKINQLEGLMKLDDVQLVNTLFPEPTLDQETEHA